MILKNSRLFLMPTVLISLILIKVASLFKVNIIFGSSMAFFSATSIAIPLTGFFGGALCSMLVFLFGSVGHLVHGGVYSWHYLAYHIPGLCASLSWIDVNSSPMQARFFKLMVPIMCFVAFLAHPVGLQAFPYACYWFIPVILYFIGAQSFFLKALQATFVAHAVGSVIWIYTMPMTVLQWYSLIPVVAVERLLYATGMVVCYNLYSYAVHLLHAQEKTNNLTTSSTR